VSESSDDYHSIGSSMMAKTADNKNTSDSNDENNNVKKTQQQQNSGSKNKKKKNKKNQQAATTTTALQINKKEGRSQNDASAAAGKNHFTVETMLDWKNQGRLPEQQDHVTKCAFKLNNKLIDQLD
jgi:hypothetical protein